MGFKFQDLPKWEFTVREISAGTYRVVAPRDGGIRGEGIGGDSESLLDDLRGWASRTEAYLRARSAAPPRRGEGMGLRVSGPGLLGRCRLDCLRRRSNA